MKKNLVDIHGRELRNAGAAAIPYQRGMTLLNSNGDIDPSSLGYQYTLQTTDQIRAKVIKQKFYEVPPAKYLSVLPGTGAWLEGIKTNLTYDIAGKFSAGIIGSAVGPSKIAQVEVGTAPITTKIITWAKGYTYTVPEVEKALAANNWDLITSKKEVLKKHWDLGIQDIAFLGLAEDETGVPGLLTNPAVATDTGTITQMISTMDASTFQTLVSTILSVYLSNANQTVMPNKFVIPLADWVGLGSASASGFPIGSKLEYLLKFFKEITGNASFEILPLAYANKALNVGRVAAAGHNRYALYHDDVDTLWMDLPVDFTLFAPNTGNNFQWEGVAAGQFCGVTIARPREVIYFDHD